MKVKIEFSKHKLDDDWWFDLGISAMPTHKCSGGDFLISLSFGLFSLYLRFKTKKFINKPTNFYPVHIETLSGSSFKALKLKHSIK